MKSIRKLSPLVWAVCGSLSLWCTEVSAQSAQATPMSNREFAALAPQEQLVRAGKGVFFKHDFAILGLPHQASHSWWEVADSLTSSTLRINLVRGKERMQIIVNDYEGPGTYSDNDFDVILRADKTRFFSEETGSHKLIIQSVNDNWISGYFSTSLRSDQAPAQMHQLTQGVFRVTTEKSAAVAIFSEE